MSDINSTWHRYALISELAKRLNGELGRTSLVKLEYFLQELRGVPLGYNFTLYLHGPFDSQILDDLGYAKGLGAVKTKLVFFNGGGYGYKINIGEKGQKVKSKAAEFLEQFRSDIDWVVEEFGGLSPRELELASTIVYIEKEAQKAHLRLSLTDFVQRVRDVKPRFTKGQVKDQIDALIKRGALHGVSK